MADLTSYMEDSLEMPLRHVLATIQARMLEGTTYHGVPAQKCPLDAWVYQEIVYETRPDVIVEIGNAFGGGALALAHLCDLLGHGRVIGVDVTHAAIPGKVRDHPRITLVEGDACASFARVADLVQPGERVLVIEDSSHTFENTLAVLRTYAGLVQPGDYFVVEDGICRHGLADGPSPGPYEAVEAFCAENDAFEVDRCRESFLITWNPKGYLRRRARAASGDDSGAAPGRARLGVPERLGWSGVARLLVPPILLQAARRARRRLSR